MVRSGVPVVKLCMLSVSSFGKLSIFGVQNYPYMQRVERLQPLTNKGRRSIHRSIAPFHPALDRSYPAEWSIRHFLHIQPSGMSSPTNGREIFVLNRDK